MTVLRVVANLTTPDPKALAGFYTGLLGLEVVMDLDFITTVAGPQPAPCQLSFASEGGSGTAVPSLSIEVDDLDAVLLRAGQMGVALEYGPVAEPWGVRRFYIRDPAGTLINILSHS